MLDITKDGVTIRSVVDDDNTVWIPIEDIARLRGVQRIRTHHLSQAGLRYLIDYKTVNWREMNSPADPRGNSGSSGPNQDHNLGNTVGDPRQYSGSSDLARGRNVGVGRGKGGGNPNRVVISEAGLYMLMMRGTSDRDLRLRYWLADEVLPALRTQHTYTLPADHPIISQLEEASQVIERQQQIMHEMVIELGDLVEDRVDLMIAEADLDQQDWKAVMKSLSFRLHAKARKDRRTIRRLEDNSTLADLVGVDATEA